MTAASRSRSYQLCTLTLFMLRSRATDLTPDEVSDMTWAALESLRDLVAPREPDPPGPLKAWTLHLATSAVERWADAHAEDGFIRERDYRTTLSKAELQELDDLSKRKPAAVERCGSDRAVDRRFEERLDEIFQRLGFVVVHARPGERAGDLLCLSRRGGGPFSLLVEAKTTRRPYALPTSDARAIREYVERIRTRLSLTPPLRFVLIVSNRREPSPRRWPTSRPRWGCRSATSRRRSSRSCSRPWRAVVAWSPSSTPF